MIRVINLLSLVAFSMCIDPKLVIPISKCHQTAPNYSTCFRDALQEVWPKFIEGGAPEHNITSLDPTFYPYHRAMYNSGDFHIDGEAFNITVTGLSGVRFLYANSYFCDKDVFCMEIEFEMPWINDVGYTKVIGTLGPFNLHTAGNFNVTGRDITTKWLITGHVANDTWTVEHFRIFPTVKTAEVHLRGFLDSPELNDVLEDFINAYWPSLFRAVVPVVVNILQPYFVISANDLLSKVSFSTIFPK